jgi:endonuclease/exonuclease/phosphatase family metal-dependent hydrolase
MIHRKRSGIKRFFQTLLGRVLKLLGLVLLVLAVSFASVLLTRNDRAATLERPEPPLSPPAQAPDSLRVLTYNIAHGRGPGLGAANVGGDDKEAKRDRLVQIGHQLKSMGLDLIFLQEVDFNTWWSHGMDQASIIAEAAGFPYIARQRNFDTGLPLFRRYDFGNALLSRLPIEEVDRLQLPPFSELEVLIAGNHDAMVAKIALSKDEQVLVIGLHLEVRSEDIRVQAAQQMIRLQRRQSLPTILLGDLNSTPPGMPDSQNSLLGQNTVELFERFGEFQRRPARGQATHHHFTFPTEGPRRTIDWVMPDRNWQILEYRVVHDIRESDHLPVMSTLRRR